MDQAMTQPVGGTPPAVLPNNFAGSATGERMSPEPTQPAAPVAQPVSVPVAPVARAASPIMPEETLALRLDRAKRKAREDILRELGVDDPAKVKSDLAELAKMRVEREKSDREKMTREQQLQADLEKERQMRADLESKLKEESVARVYEKQDGMITDIARRYVDANRLKLDTARRAFAEHVETLPKQTVARLTDKDIDKWFAKFAKDNPDFATKSATPPAPVEPVRRAITTATPAARKQAPPSPVPTTSDPTVNVQGKTFKPGQQNSMSRAEVSAELKRRGIRGWR